MIRRYFSETRRTVSSINFCGGRAPMVNSDIPVLTDKQLTQFRRSPKKLVAVRLDADVFEWLQQYGAGYSARINNVLRVVMSQDDSGSPRRSYSVLASIPPELL